MPCYLLRYYFLVLEVHKAAEMQLLSFCVSFVVQYNYYVVLVVFLRQRDALVLAPLCAPSNHSKTRSPYGNTSMTALRTQTPCLLWHVLQYIVSAVYCVCSILCARRVNASRVTHGAVEASVSLSCPIMLDIMSALCFYLIVAMRALLEWRTAVPPFELCDMESLPPIWANLIKAQSAVDLDFFTSTAIL